MLQIVLFRDTFLRYGNVREKTRNNNTLLGYGILFKGPELRSARIQKVKSKASLSVYPLFSFRYMRLSGFSKDLSSTNEKLDTMPMPLVTLPCAFSFCPFFVIEIVCVGLSSLLFE